MALTVLEKTIQIKKPLDEKTKDELLKQIYDARSVIIKTKEELDAYRDAFNELSKTQNAIIDKCLLQSNTGYVLTNVLCDVDVVKGKEVFTTKDGQVIPPEIIVAEQQLDLGDDK